MKIEKKAKGKGKGEAIIGIAMAAIMLASVIAAMIGGIGAYSVGGAYNIIEKDMGATVQAVLIGQDLDFFTYWGSAESDRVTISRVKGLDGVVWTKTADPDNTLTIAGDDWKKEGAFYVNFNTTTWTGEAQLSFSDVDMPLELKVGTKKVSSIAPGTNLKIDTGGMNLFPEDRIALVIIGPKGQMKYDGINDQQFTNISVAELNAWYGDNNLKTRGWTFGDYTFQVKTKSEYACGVDAASAVKDIEITLPGDMLLYENWNFISVPKELAEGNNTFEQVFGAVDTSGHSIFYYDTAEGWRTVTATDEVKPLMGYWIYSAEGTGVNLTYDTYPLRTPPTKQLYKGWNAIAFSDTTAASANSALTSIEKNWAYLIGFNAAKQEYESAIINNDDLGGVHDEDNSMYPMKGYWIYVTEDCELAGISV